MYSQDYLVKARQDDLPRAGVMRVDMKRTPRQNSSHRFAVRLWTLLHAQSLLNGPGSGADPVALMEDDYRRLRRY